MKKIFDHLLLLGIAISLAACNNPTSGTPDNGATMKDTTEFDLVEAKAWIQDELIKFSEDFRKGDTIALASYYSSDAYVMPPGMEALTKKDVASMWGFVLRMGIKDMKLKVNEVLGNDDLLVEIGTYEMYAENNQLAEKGKYISILKKENGTWKVHRDIWNTDMPMEAAK